MKIILQGPPVTGTGLETAANKKPLEPPHLLSMQKKQNRLGFLIEGVLH